MPFDEVMPKFKRGDLRSGTGKKGKKGKKVQSRKQAIAIMLSEKAKAHSETEYASRKFGGKR